MEEYSPDNLREDELNKKKELLQREIVDGNYNKDQFIDYCLALKPYGDDLSQWSYEELKSAVNSFITYHQQEDLREKQEQQMKNQIQDQTNQMQNQMNQINNINYYNNNNNNNSNNNVNTPYSNNNKYNLSKKYNLDCRKLEKSQLSNKKVVITIKNPKAVETSIFKSNYISYEVYTDVTQWQVIRRYSDFDWLRQTLKKIHPGIYCPPIPGKKMGSRRFENDFVVKRMKYLNKFLNDIVENEIFKASEILISFLSIADREQFEFKKKSFDSMKSPERVEYYYSLNGKLTLLEDDYNETSYTNVQNYIKLQTQLLNRMNYNLKNYIINITSACNNLEDIQKDFEMLTQLNKIVSMKEEITKTYEELTI